MSNEIDEIIAFLQKDKYKFAQTEDQIVVQLPKLSTAIINKSAPFEKPKIIFGKVKMETAIALYLPCLFFMIYFSFNSNIGIALLPLVIFSIYWETSRIRNSMRFKAIMQKRLQDPS